MTPDHDTIKNHLEFVRKHARVADCPCPAHGEEIHWQLYEANRRSRFLTLVLQSLADFARSQPIARESEDGGIDKSVHLWVKNEDWWMARSIILDAESLGWVERT